MHRIAQSIPDDVERGICRAGRLTCSKLAMIGVDIMTCMVPPRLMLDFKTCELSRNVHDVRCDGWTSQYL